MAPSRSGSSNHDTTESLPYSFGKGVKTALDTFLQKRDPKQVKADQKNSSAGRARKNVVESLSDFAILEELLRRHRVERKRENDRERQQRHREKLARLQRQQG